MNEMLFKHFMNRAEDIIRGIDKKMAVITEEEWINLEFGAMCVESLEEKIELNKVFYQQMLLSSEISYDVQLFRKNEEIIERAERIFNEISFDNMDFSTLENVFVSVLNMCYYARTYGSITDRINIDSILEKCNIDEKKKYLELISEIIYYNWLQGFEVINHKELGNIAPNIKILINEAIAIYPDAEVAYMYKEIEVINNFFQDSSDDNLEKVKEICFSEKGEQFIGHIMTHASSRMWDVYVPQYRFLPHINYEFGNDMKLNEIESLKNSEPKGYYSWKEQEYHDEVDLWHENTAKFFLKIPYTISIKQSEGEILYNLMANIMDNKKKNEILQKLNKDRQDVLNYYMHSWKHISYPQIVNNVAEELLKNGNLPLGNKLKCAYDSEKTLQNGIQLVQYMISDNEDEVKNNFKRSIYLINAKSGIGVQNIIERSLKIVMFKIVMEEADSSNKIEKCRNALKCNIEKLREKYIDAFIRSNSSDSSIIKWFENTGYKLDVSLSDEWKQIKVKENEFAEARLTEIFVELFRNAIIHGSGDAKGIKLKLSSDEKTMKINMINSFDKNRSNGSKKGISTLSNIISKINMSSDIEGVKKEEENNMFSITVSFDREIIYRKGRK